MFTAFVIPISLTITGTMVLLAFTSKPKFERALPYSVLSGVMFGGGVFVWNSAILFCIERFKNSHGGEEIFIYESYEPLIISNFWYALPLAMIIIFLFLNYFEVHKGK